MEIQFGYGKIISFTLLQLVKQNIVLEAKLKVNC